MIDLKTRVIKNEPPKKPRFIFYGRPKIGKSTFAASIPKCLIIDIEDGLGEIDCEKIKVSSYDEFIETIVALASQEHDYEALAIDSADWLENLVYKKVCIDQGVNSIGEIGFGKGYILAETYWGGILDGLDHLREQKNMTIVLLAHDQVKRYNDPTTESYDRYQPNLHEKSSELIRGWCDGIIFLGYKTITRSEDVGFNKKKVKAANNSQRVLYTEETPAIVAGNRFGLPSVISFDDLSWLDFQKLLTKKPKKEA